MGETTAIEWTDASWNPLRARADVFVGTPPRTRRERTGWHCEHVSEGCRNCYAETMNKRLGTGLDYKPGNLAPRGPVTLFLDEKLLLAPLKWRKTRRIFLSSMTDIFGDWVSDADLDRIFAVMALCPQHVFQVLTKRPERMREYLARAAGCIGDAAMALRKTPLAVAKGLGPNAIGPLPHIEPGAQWFPLPNVWLGVSVEDQAAADARIRHLLATPAAKRFLSCEPLISKVDLSKWLYEQRHFSASDVRSRNLHDGCGGEIVEASRSGQANFTEEGRHRAEQGGRISSPAIHGRADQVCGRRSSDCLDADDGAADTGWHGNQSSQRREIGQSPDQPRTGNSLSEREAQLRRIGPEDEGAARQNEHLIQAGRGGGFTDSCASEIGSAAKDAGRAIRGISANNIGDLPTQDLAARPLIDWVIAGGESGPGARPMHPDWARSLRDQCAAAGVPFLFKQWGEWAPVRKPDPVVATDRWVKFHTVANPLPGAIVFDETAMRKLGKKRAGRLLDGVQHDGVPA